MRINWYPIAGLLLIVFIWLMIAAGGWLIWKTVLQPKVSSMELDYCYRGSGGLYGEGD